jgi:hypothetical protein
MKRSPLILFSTLLLGVLATPMVFQGIAAATSGIPTQTTDPVPAGSPTTYSTITATSATRNSYVALVASGMPTGSVPSDTGDGTDGCVQVPGNGSVSFTHFSVTAGDVSGTFTLTADQYSNSSCSSQNPTTLATWTPTLAVKLAVTNVAGVGNGNHARTWTTTYKRP